MDDPFPLTHSTSATMPKEIISVTSGQPIQYSFKRITYRQFRKAMNLLEDSKEAATREQRDAMAEECAEIMIDGAKLLFDEAANIDVQGALVAAIEFNQGSEADSKKSE
jgi:hypothetical protein